MQVVVMGLGYIGLPTAALMAGKGLAVRGVDVNAQVVDTINRGKIHIIEPDLEGLVHYAVREKRLVAATEPAAADVFLIAVPTPFSDDHRPDLRYVESAVRMVLPFLREGNLLILESTSPVGTTEQMAGLVFGERPELSGKLHVAYCPERVLPGRIIHELQFNDRVIGGIDEASTAAAARFYGQFVQGNLHPTRARTAEMCKLAENAYRDVNIAFANELSLISDKAGIDVNELIDLACKHPRVRILRPGPGVGGHCIAVDPWFLISAFPDEARLMRQARVTNTAKKDWVLSKVTATAADLHRQLGRPPVIACMGLTYKADIDDTRESPSMDICRSLAAGHRVLAVEPHLEEVQGLTLSAAGTAVRDADLVVFLVAHRAFEKLSVPEDKTVLDFCGALH
jgi:UDP-N-acetyl-D-mannosaminuronic acid dehydrogenase